MLPALQLSLQFADARHRALLPRHRVARWVRTALAAPAQITVRIVGADEGRALNRDYRGKDYATNVLTFDYERAHAGLARSLRVALTEARARVVTAPRHCAGRDAGGRIACGGQRWMIPP